jgi:hypothetical protein
MCLKINPEENELGTHNFTCVPFVRSLALVYALIITVKKKL